MIDPSKTLGVLAKNLEKRPSGSGSDDIEVEVAIVEIPGVPSMREMLVPLKLAVESSEWNLVCVVWTEIGAFSRTDTELDEFFAAEIAKLLDDTDEPCPRTIAELKQ